MLVFANIPQLRMLEAVVVAATAQHFHLERLLASSDVFGNIAVWVPVIIRRARCGNGVVSSSSLDILLAAFLNLCYLFSVLTLL